MKRIKAFKLVFLILALSFLLTALLFSVFCASSFIEGSANHTKHELFYWLSISSGTICLCILPIMSFLNGLQSKKEADIRTTLNSTSCVLNGYAELVNSNEYRFAASVLSCFYIDLGVTDKVESFHYFDSNRVFYDSIESSIKTAVISNNHPNRKDWHDYLGEAINDCWHLFTLDVSLKSIDLSIKIDYFYKSLLYAANKMEVMAYEFLQIKIDKKTFVEELYSRIDRFYIMAYFILHEIGYLAEFPNLDSACRMVFDEKNKEKCD